MQSSLGTYPDAVHEFRIPPKALLGLHSYCPVHFDSLHTVLVDVSVHVSLLKASSSTAPSKVPSFLRVIVFEVDALVKTSWSFLFMLSWQLITYVDHVFIKEMSIELFQ